MNQTSHPPSTICLSTIAGNAIMASSLYAATVPSYRQILGAVSGRLDTAEAFSTEKGIAPEDIIQARLAEMSVNGALVSIANPSKRWGRKASGLRAHA
jgi:hypothetical protein